MPGHEFCLYLDWMSDKHRIRKRRTARGGWQIVVATVFAVLLLQSCASSPRFTSHPPAPKPDDSGVSYEPERTEIVQHAKSFIGTPYRNGGATRNGMDCSGLVMKVYYDFGIRLPRTAYDQSRAGREIGRSELQPGDLVFFRTSRGGISHVGIYVGSGSFVHASTGGHRVKVDQLSSDYFRARYVTARDVIDG